MRAMLPCGSGLRIGSWRWPLGTALCLAWIAGVAVAAPIDTSWRFDYEAADGTKLPVRLGKLEFFDQQPDGMPTFRQIGVTGLTPPLTTIYTPTTGVGATPLDNFEAGGIDPIARLTSDAKLGTKTVKIFKNGGGNPAAKGAPYTADSAVQANANASFGPVVTNLPARTTDDGKAFAAMDALVTGMRYADFVGAAVTQVDVVFPSSSTRVRQLPSTPRAEIVMDILAGDAFDWDVVLHEYGHAVSDRDKFDDSPGGAHNFRTLVNEKLSWSEGFATYFGSAAQHWENSLAGANRLPNASLGDGTGSIRGSVDVYHDKVDNNLEWSLETRNTYKTKGVAKNEAAGDKDEMSVSRILWDLMDNTNQAEGKADNVWIDHKPLYDLIKRPVTPAMDPNPHGPYTLAEFEKSILNFYPSKEGKARIGDILAEHRSAAKAVEAKKPAPPAPILSPGATAPLLLADAGPAADAFHTDDDPDDNPFQYPDPAPNFSIPVVAPGEEPLIFEWLSQWGESDPNRLYDVFLLRGTGAPADPAGNTPEDGLVHEELELLGRIAAGNGFTGPAPTLGDRSVQPDLLNVQQLIGSTFVPWNWDAFLLENLGRTITWDVVSYLVGENPLVDGIWGSTLRFSVVPEPSALAALAVCLACAPRTRRRG